MKAPLFVLFAASLLAINAHAGHHTFVNQQRSTCEDDCNNEHAPVCGTDGKTYNNFCRFHVAVCKNNSLTLASVEACPTKASSDAKNPQRTVKPSSLFVLSSADGHHDSSSDENDDVDAGESGEDDEMGSGSNQGFTVDYCGIRCTEMYMPVCGSDGRTYGNTCMLLAATCEDPTLTQVSEGDCCDSVCEDSGSESSPVCASDGQTYASICEFRKQKCRVDGNLWVIEFDECASTPQKNGKDKQRQRCGNSHCGRHEVCLTDVDSGESFCAMACDDRFCEEEEICELRQVQCFRAPCPPVPTCVTY